MKRYTHSIVAAPLGAAFLLAPLAGAQVVYGEHEPAADLGKDQSHLFEAPVRVAAADGSIRTEAPGYAAPAWYDVDGDGRRDLVVGQFAGGKMRVYKSTGAGTFAPGEWLMAAGEVAEVPGVW